MRTSIIYTNHARQRMAERGITEDDVEQVLAWPDYVISSGDRNTMAAKKFKGREVHIVYKAQKERIILITAY